MPYGRMALRIPTPSAPSHPEIKTINATAPMTAAAQLNARLRIFDSFARPIGWGLNLIDRVEPREGVALLRGRGFGFSTKQSLLCSILYSKSQSHVLDDHIGNTLLILA